MLGPRTGFTMQINATSAETPPPPSPPRSAALAEALRRCEVGDCAGVLVGGRQPALAAALLEEAANAGDGLVWRPRGGGFWLLGTSPAAAARAARNLDRMGLAPQLLEFPRDLPVLDTAVAQEGGSEPHRPAPPPSLAGLEERAEALPAATALPLSTVWHMRGHQPVLLAQRWGTAPGALLPGMARNWTGHAESLLAARLLRLARGQQWPTGRKASLPLLLDMPWLPTPPDLPRPPPGEGHALVLPLAALPEGAAWAAAAARAGWGLAWWGMGAELAGLMEPGRLPGGDGLVLAPYEGALAQAPGPAPERLVLCGPPSREALALSQHHGFALCHGMGA